MEVINDLLNYNNLKIVQNTEWFSFSLDSILLANFANVTRKTKVIDFCTGNAPIPLFLSKKTDETIIGVEIQKEVYDLAIKSVSINNLNSKIKIINNDVKELLNLYDSDIFDVITCNPPYFKYQEDSNINTNYIKSLARHEITVTLDDIFLVARKLLKNKGRIAMIHRTDRLIDIISLMRNNNIEPKRMQLVYPFEGKESNLVMVEGSKNGSPGFKVEPSIIVHNEDGTYKEDIQKLFSGGNYEN